MIARGYGIWGYIDEYECMRWDVEDNSRQPNPTKRLTSDSPVIATLHAV